MDERFYGVVRDSDESYYAGNGEFTDSVLGAARFFSLDDAGKAASSLNQQGICDGSCKAKIIYVDYPLKTDKPTEVDFYSISEVVKPSLDEKQPLEFTVQNEPVKSVCSLDRATVSEVRVVGNYGDLIEYWTEGRRWIFDQIRDGDYLTCGSDVVFHPNSGRGSKSCFAVRHGKHRDLVRLYAPLGNGDYIFLFERDPYRPYYYVDLKFESPTVVYARDRGNIIRTYKLNEAARRWEAS